jgi:YVTN family beta-propeller protein
MGSCVGVPMKVLRVGWLAALFILIIIELSCGDTYRPVAVPQPPSPPNPGALHYMIVVTGNGPVNPGTNLRLDVSGDTAVSQAQVGLGPVHLAVLPNGNRTYVANSMDGTVSSFLSGNPFAVTTTVLPTSGGNPEPIFIATTENATAYVANYAASTVDAITVATNTVTFTIPVGANPVAMVETADSNHLYSVNLGGNSVTSIDPVSKTVKTTIPVGTAPVWALARSDNQKVYVLNTGSGTVSSIDTLSDTATCGVSGTPPCPVVGAGANYMFYERFLNRIYVTNPVTNNLVILNAATDPPTAVGNPIPIAASPVSITALSDGSRIYVGSMKQVAPCTSNPSDTRPCIQSQVTVLNAIDGSLRSVIPLQAAVTVTGASVDSAGNTTYTYSPVAGPPLQAGMTIVISGVSDSGNNGTFLINSVAGNGFTVANALGVADSGQSGSGATVVEVDTANPTGCTVNGLGTPGGTIGGARFRMFVAAGASDQRVYVGTCDAGSTTIIRTVLEGANPPDSIVLTVPSAPSAFPPPTPGLQPPGQNPFFIFAST